MAFKSTQPCPKCKSWDILTFHYGLIHKPSPKGFIWGGCVLRGPQWKCNACGHAWGNFAKAMAERIKKLKLPIQWSTSNFQLMRALNPSIIWYIPFIFALTLRISSKLGTIWSSALVVLLIVLFLIPVRFKINHKNGIKSGFGSKSWEEIAYYGITERGIFFFDRNQKFLLALARHKHVDLEEIANLIPKHVKEVKVVLGVFGPKPLI